MKPAVAHHRAAHVQQDDRRATRDAFVLMKLEILFIESDSAPALGFDGQAVAGQGVVKRLMEVQLGDGVAIGIRLGAVDALLAGAGGDALVPFALALLEIGEDLHERFPLHFGDRPAGQAQAALFVLVQHAVFEQLLQHVGLRRVIRIVHHLFDRLKGSLAMFHDELHELIEAEEFVGGREFLPVEFAVEILHDGDCMNAEWQMPSAKWSCAGCAQTFGCRRPAGGPAGSPWKLSRPVLRPILIARISRQTRYARRKIGHSEFPCLRVG